MKKLICIVLALAMMLCLTACGKPLSEEIVGSWVTYIDMSEQMAKNEDTEGFETEVKLPILITFDEDGEVTMEPYGDEAEAAIEQLEADMLEYMLDTFYASMEESGYTREQADELYEAAYGMTVSEYFEAYIDSVGLYDSFETSFTSEGEYEVDDEEMILEIDGDEFTVELDGDTLTFVEAEDEDAWEDIGFSLPQEFTRVDD